MCVCVYIYIYTCALPPIEYENVYNNITYHCTSPHPPEPPNYDPWWSG